MLLNHKSKKIKLIDFGLSRKLKEKEVVKEMMGTPEFVGKEIMGTPEFVGKEMMGTPEFVGKEIMGTPEFVGTEMMGTPEFVGKEIMGTPEEMMDTSLQQNVNRKVNEERE